MTNTYDYWAIRDMVLEMTPEDQARLCKELKNYGSASEPETAFVSSKAKQSIEEDDDEADFANFPSFGPRTKEEAIARVRQAEQDIINGNTIPAEKGWAMLKEEFPWLEV